MTAQFSGRVVRGVIATGSKSEREAVLLRADDGDLVLRRKDANPLADPELDALVGKRITARGVEHRGVLIIDDWVERSD